MWHQGPQQFPAARETSRECRVGDGGLEIQRTITPSAGVWPQSHAFHLSASHLHLHIRRASPMINSLGYSFPARWLCPVQSTYETTEEIHGKANEYCRAEREAWSAVARHGRGCNNFHGGRGCCGHEKKRTRRHAHAEGGPPPGPTPPHPLP